MLMRHRSCAPAVGRSMSLVNWTNVSLRTNILLPQENIHFWIAIEPACRLGLRRASSLSIQIDRPVMRTSRCFRFASGACELSKERGAASGDLQQHAD